MNDTELKAEVELRLAAEVVEPAPGVYWLSFAGEDGWLGGCYVEAIGQVHAIQKTHQLGINPGGEVAILGPMTRERWDEQSPPGHDLDTLLQREDFPAGDLIRLPDDDD